MTAITYHNTKRPVCCFDINTINASSKFLINYITDRIGSPITSANLQ